MTEPRVLITTENDSKQPLLELTVFWRFLLALSFGAFFGRFLLALSFGAWFARTDQRRPIVTAVFFWSLGTKQ